MAGRACTYEMPDGRTCRATPLRAAPFCFWHSPDTADDLAEARRTGGYHRRKKRAVATIYGFNGLRTIEDLQSLLETVAIETMALDNSVSRNRTISGFVAVGAKLLETGDLADRLAALEAVAQRPREPAGSGDLE
jgi:hypothetical protein